MRPPHTRRGFLAAGASAAVVALAGCAESSESSTSTPSDRDRVTANGESLGLAHTKSSASYPSDGEVHSGWVHIVSDGESADLTFDARFCESLGAVEPALLDATNDEYVLRFEVSGEFAGEAPTGTVEASSCSRVTRLVGGANVPSDWERLAVTVNDVEIQSVERSGTTPELRPLPDPMRSP